MKVYRATFAILNCFLFLQLCFFTAYLPNKGRADYKPKPPVTCQQDVKADIEKAKQQIDEIRKLVKGMQEQPQPKDLQWNRYVTDNFEILSLDDAQGKYLSENIEFMKIWTLWRWGMKDFDFPIVKSNKGDSVRVRVKLICVPNADLYEKLFNKKTPGWRFEVNKDGVPEYSIWYITDGNKWYTKLPVMLTEIALTNFEANTGSRLPVWCHRGMSVLNGRIEDIRARLPQVNTFDSKSLLTTTQSAYDKMSDQQRATFDAQAAFFCLWARQEFNGKVFLDYLGGSMINPEYCLQYFNLRTFADCDARVKAYAAKLSTAADYSFTW